MNERTKIVLSIKGLKVAYPGCAGLHYPEIVLECGKCVALSGPTGCGKSSLLNALFQPRFRAQVDYTEASLLGRDLRSYGDDLYRVVSYMPQYSQDGLNPMLTASEQIGAVLEGNSVVLSEAELEKAVVNLRLDTAMLTLYPHQMSGGMKQRLMLLMAVLKHPALLVLDEPSSAIDALTLKVMLDFLLVVKSGGMAILMVSHDTGFSRYLADRSIQLEGLRK